MSNTIKVTAEDIAFGWKGDCRRCPIARAIDRRLAKPYYAKVADRITIHETGRIGAVASCWVPSSAYMFMANFDDGRPVEPFEFTLPELSPGLFNG